MQRTRPKMRSYKSNRIFGSVSGGLTSSLCGPHSTKSFVAVFVRMWRCVAAPLIGRCDPWAYAHGYTLPPLRGSQIPSSSSILGSVIPRSSSKDWALRSMGLHPWLHSAAAPRLTILSITPILGSVIPRSSSKDWALASMGLRPWLHPAAAPRLTNPLVRRSLVQSFRVVAVMNKRSNPWAFAYGFPSRGSARATKWRQIVAPSICWGN